MRILLTGAGGQLGRALQVALGRHQLIALERRELDITDPAAVREALRRHRPELVLNAAAYTRVDGAESEPEAAFAVNAEGPRYLAKASAAGGIALLHMSTDYVFDGTANCPYDESAPANPRSVYGASKLAGEQAVREHNPRHLIVRTAWLYHTVGHNFPTTMLALAGRGEVRVVDDQRGSPTYAPHLTAAIARLIESGAAGIYHLAGSGAASWYELACELFRRCGIDTPVIPVGSAAFPRPAERPRYSVLTSIHRAEIELPPWREGVASFARALRSRAEGPFAETPQPG